MTITLHMLAFVSGFLLDCLFGDPYWMPHPVRFMGNLISFLDKKLMGEKHKGEEKKADAPNVAGVKYDATKRSELRKGIICSRSNYDISDFSGKMSAKREHKGIHRIEKK